MRAKPILSVLSVLFCAASAWAAGQFTWDPNGNNGGGGAGNWDVTSGNTVWWNGSADVLWAGTGTSASSGAVFNGPDAAAGTYIVTIDGPQVAVTNLQINANGYVFNGAVSSNSLYVNSSDVLSVAAGKTVTFNCSMAGSGTDPAWQLGSGATMNVTGNLLGTQQLHMGAPANSAFNLTGGNSAPAQLYVLGPVNVTSGTIIPTSSVYIGYLNNNTINGTTYTSGTLTVSGSGTITENKQLIFVARGGGAGTLTIQNGGIVNVGTSANENLAISYAGNAGDNALVNVQGGFLMVGSSIETTSQIAFFDSGASAASATGALVQTGGTISAWGGIVIGLGGGTGSASFASSGGTLNVGPGGITKGASYTGPYTINLSGGTVGDLTAPGWSSSLPIALGTTNGNVTFDPVNTITLSGPLTGTGGLNVTAGTLSLSGANNYSGDTTVGNNGTLAVATGSLPISGALTLDGSSGSPTVTVNSTAGSSWSIGGALTFQNGTTTLAYQFASLPPSSSVSPLQVSGDVNFTATPNVAIAGSAIAAGTYPLIQYTGAFTGTLPTPAISLSGGSASGILSNNATSKTISVVVTSSTYVPAVTWRVGNGVWDINTTPNWKQSTNSVDYEDGDAVLFDDTATGSSPITVTLNTTVSPLSVTANNSSKNYVITGAGNIGGSASLSLLNNGTLTLATTNNYNGGTTLSAGQLNINNGNAIGSGQLTINGGVIDNTSGGDVTLQPSVPEVWNGNFTYLGSAHDLNVGPGGVTMSGNISINVSGGDFIIPAEINDNSLNYVLTKSGSGALTLGTYNQISGGVTLTAGLLNLGDGSAAGSGTLTINAPNGCSLDNVSGNGLTLGTAAYAWTTGFEFIGSAGLDFGQGTVTGNTDPLPVTIQIDANALTNQGVLNFGNVTVNKSGPGTWVMGGTAGNSLNLVIQQGTVEFNKTKAQSVNGTKGLTVETSGLAQDEQPNQMHSDTLNSPQTVTLQGGTWDLNGNTENVDIIAMKSGGTLQNSAAGVSAMTNISGYTDTLSGMCYFEIDQAGAAFNLHGALAGDGTETLVKTGLGTLGLFSNNVYTGETVISNGTLLLGGVGSLADTAGIDLATNSAVLDMTSNIVSEVLTLQNGQTLSGFGTVKGLVQSLSGAVIAPGLPGTIGTLTVSGVAGANTLGGTTMMKLDKGHLTSDQLAVSGSLVYGGTLALTNLSGSLAMGDSFTLFSGAIGYSGTFASITPSTPGPGLAWSINNGTLSIVTGPTAPPGFSVLNLSGTTLTIHGTNGPANQQFVLVGTTNIMTPVTNWLPVVTNTFDGSGNFSVSISATNAVEFLLLKTQ